MRLFTLGSTAALLTAASALAACVPSNPEDALAEFCREAIQSRLTSPSSYSEVRVTAVNSASNTSAHIQFDADNAFGASVRGSARCEFERMMRTNDDDAPSLSAFTLNGEAYSEQEVALLNADVRVELARR